MSKPASSLAVVTGTLFVGWIDYRTGTEIHVVSLYFLPLLWAGWSLETTGAVLAALFTTLVWLAVLALGGTHFSSPYIWVINTFTDGFVFLAVSLLVARLRAAVNRESVLGRADPLTGLANRRAFIDIATHSLALSRRSGRPVSLAYLDLDNFKAVNDTFGHHRGDSVLCQCANLLTDRVRASDTVARIGGDEFAILMPETDAESAFRLLEQIRIAINSAPAFTELAVTTSIGVVCDPRGESDIHTLLDLADARMYKVKRGEKKASLQQI